MGLGALPVEDPLTSITCIPPSTALFNAFSVTILSPISTILELTYVFVPTTVRSPVIFSLSIF